MLTQCRSKWLQRMQRAMMWALLLVLLVCYTRPVAATHEGIDHWSRGGTYTVTERGSATAVWTGSRMIVWGGYDGSSTYYNTGGVYDPDENEWTSVSTTGAPTARYFHTAVWTGNEMIVWGGTDGNMLFDTATRSICLCLYGRKDLRFARVGVPHPRRFDSGYSLAKPLEIILC